MNYSVFRTPRKYIGITFSSKGISAVVLPKETEMEVYNEIMELHKGEFLMQVNPPDDIKAAFLDYFSGKKKKLSSLDLDMKGTDFEKKVWKACMQIPYGEVRSYSWIANKIGNPSSSRAVGNALNKNPVPIIVPCHRVISSDGNIGGFASGLEVKRKLLELEAKH